MDAVSIGNALREAREARGLDLLGVHDRLGRPITQLEALEAGDLSRLPDQVFALSTLRRYARFLALDGDALALAFLESWSAAAEQSGRDGGAATAATGVVTAVVPQPEHLRAFTQTGPVPPVGGGGGPWFSGAPTGTLTIAPREEIEESMHLRTQARRRERAPLGLRVVTWVVAILAVAAVVGAGIQHWHPQSFAQWHVLHVTQPGGVPLPAGSGTSTSPPTHPAAVPVKQASTDGETTATYTVAAKTFKVVLTTTAPCYVEVTSPASVNPIVEAVQAPNVTKSYPADGSLTVQVGAAEVSISVVIHGKSQFKTVPQHAPFTYTFNSTNP